MFTGIVEACVPVLRFETRGEGARLVLPRPEPGWEVQLGDSVSVSGCCLTVAEFLGDELAFDLSAETLERTWLGGLAAGFEGRTVNLERALRMGDRLGGHLVSGHVDAVGEIVEIRDVGDGGRVFGFQLAGELDRYLIEKGSVTLDGISLTVVEPSAGRFGVAVIPVTLEVTTLGKAAVGDRVNVEVDLVGKWLEKLIPPTGR